MRRAFIAFLTGLLIQSLFLQPAFAQTRPVPAQARPVPAQTIPGPAYRINPGDEIMVSVSVTNPAGYTFSVIGKVKSPGTFTPGRYVNALEALTIAGGPSEFASVGNAVILRKYGQQIQTIKIRLSDAIRGDARRLTESDIPFIQSGDTLVVP